MHQEVFLCEEKQVIVNSYRQEFRRQVSGRSMLVLESKLEIEIQPLLAFRDSKVLSKDI